MNNLPPASPQSELTLVQAQIRQLTNQIRTAPSPMRLQALQKELQNSLARLKELQKQVPRQGLPRIHA